MSASVSQRQSTPDSRRMLTRIQAAEYLNVSVGTLARWASDRTGPAFVKLSQGKGGVRYPTDVLDAFVERLLQHPKDGGAK